jgi:ubiquitin C-terminal hydrolase
MNLLFNDALKSTSKDTECSVAESVLLNTLAEILNQCMVHNSCSSLDPMAFRQAASTLHSVLVAPPSQRQVQQDAAEFFMWLMDTVHFNAILNSAKYILQSINSLR